MKDSLKNVLHIVVIVMASLVVLVIYNGLVEAPIADEGMSGLPNGDHLQVVLNHNKLVVELASESSERSRGLSGRVALREGRGMLFVFEEEGNHGFWMKDMNFPIDIFWINKNYEIVTVERDVAPESYPEIFYPEDLAMFVLETNTGEVDEVSVGDEVFIINPNSKQLD